MTSAPSVATRPGATIEIGGVTTYFERTGHGEPLVLLHGGLTTAEAFDAQVPALAGRYHVLVPERHGHGRTPDVPGAITYEAMAQHTVSFIEATVDSPARLVGWSDGALVALLVALRRPALVRKLVLIDQSITQDGAPEPFRRLCAEMTVDDVPPSLRRRYEAVSPDGASHFPVVFEKLHRMWTSPTGVDVDDLGHVRAPTLFLCADAGAVSLAHIATVMTALPSAQLAIVPGASHTLVMDKPHLVNHLLVDFLADEPVSC